MAGRRREPVQATGVLIHFAAVLLAWGRELAAFAPAKFSTSYSPPWHSNNVH